MKKKEKAIVRVCFVCPVQYNFFTQFYYFWNPFFENFLCIGESNLFYFKYFVFGSLELKSVNLFLRYYIHSVNVREMAISL